MKHADQITLAGLQDLLQAIRQFGGLKEKTPGSFYYKAGGFVHFHQDPAGLFADLKIAGQWQRFKISTLSEQEVLLAEIAQVLSK